MNNYEKWKRVWRDTIRAAEDLGCTDTQYELDPPATDSEVVKVQNEIGIVLPPTLVCLFKNLSKGILVGWQLPYSYEIEEFPGVTEGKCDLSLGDLRRLVVVYRALVRDCFPDSNDEAQAIWYGKLPIQGIDNGDYIGIDLQLPDGPVVYLSHEHSRYHGYILGQSIEDFIDRWSCLGCVGPASWQWEKFAPYPGALLDPQSETARLWRKAFGMKELA